MEERTSRISHVAIRASLVPVVRRRWEAELPREEIGALLADRRYLDLLIRLGEARARWPMDLELLRSMRVLEHHLGVRVAKTA